MSLEALVEKAAAEVEGGGGAKSEVDDDPLNDPDWMLDEGRGAVVISGPGADSDAVADSDPVTMKLAEADSEGTPVVTGGVGSDSVAETTLDSLAT